MAGGGRPDVLWAGLWIRPCHGHAAGAMELFPLMPRRWLPGYSNASAGSWGEHPAAGQAEGSYPSFVLTASGQTPAVRDPGQAPA